MAFAIIAVQRIRRSVVKKYYERETPLWVLIGRQLYDAEMVLLCVAPIDPTPCRRAEDSSHSGRQDSILQTCYIDWAIARSLVACSKH